jgi:hypothetical protein
MAQITLNSSGITSSGALALQSNGTTTAVTVDTSQNVGIGTTSPTARLHVQSTGGTVFNLKDNTASGGGYANIFFSSDTVNANGYLGYNNSTNAMNFGTNNTERARIDSSGNLLVGTTSADPVSTNVSGISLEGPVGSGKFSRSANPGLDVNRKTNDGELVRFYQDGTQEGSISVSGTTVSYNGGHLSRYAQTTTSKDESLVKGTVLSNLDEMSVYIKDGQPVANEQLNKVKVSDIEGDINVAGVFVNWTHDEVHNVDEINMAMTGDMIIRIAQGVTVQRGDLLKSAGNGTAEPQGDDIVRSKTIAKVTSTHVTCTYADGSYCVPCVLMAC